jgi:hypothetical protein
MDSGILMIQDSILVCSPDPRIPHTAWHGLCHAGKPGAAQLSQETNHRTAVWGLEHVHVSQAEHRNNQAQAHLQFLRQALVHEVQGLWIGSPRQPTMTTALGWAL